MRRMPQMTIRVEVSGGNGISLFESAVLRGQDVKLNGEVSQLMQPIVRNLAYEVAKQLFNQLDEAE